MLVPAGVLVLVVLAAIAVDSSVVFLAERELANAAAAAANDAATVALDTAVLRTEDRFVLDERRAAQVARAAALRQTSAVRVRPEDVEVVVDGRRVTVRMRGTVEHVFAKAIPGAARTTTVEAAATAELRGG